MTEEPTSKDESSTDAAAQGVDEGEERAKQHLLGQLFAALTARWRDGESHLNIGVRQHDLLEALHTNREGLDQLFNLLRQQIAPLGLELVEYRLGRETRYCLRTLYGVPSELTNPEYAVLGVIIAAVENAGTRRRARKTTPKELDAALVTRGRLSRYQLDKILRRLADLGYIVRSTNRIAYGPRTELEFDAERRKAIASTAATYLVGTTSSKGSGDGESQ